MPYRIRHVVLPHVDEQGVLVRHVSHNSMAPELALSESTLRLNAPDGDILLLLTDGIATLEEEMVIKDPSGTLWRLQPTALQLILEKLHAFLSIAHDHMSMQADLAQFATCYLLCVEDAKGAHAFALEQSLRTRLAESASPRFECPEYVADAIRWVCGDVPAEAQP